MARREATDLPTSEDLVRWGLEPSWSREVSFEDGDGTVHTWHVLDTGPGPRGTVVCVHGNPSWAYVWRDLLGTLAPAWRVIAVDQTGMGFSPRAAPRRLAERVDELVQFCRHEVDGPLVFAAHDWGGPVALGAAASLDVRAVILANTAVARPSGGRVPPVIGLARRLSDLVGRRSALFVAGAAATTSREHRAALRAPYRTASRRRAIAHFVDDIPLDQAHPSWSALHHSAESLASLTCPVLVIWGGRDPVFHERFLRDLRQRAPHAQVERVDDAGHYVTLDYPAGALVRDWLDHALAAPLPAAERSPDRPGDPAAPGRALLAPLAEHAEDPSLVYRGPDGSLSWSQLARRSDVAAAVLWRGGLRPGDRISLLLAPSSELLIAAVAVWKVGAVVVVADSSAGLRSLRRLVRAAAPVLIIGTAPSLAVARVARFAPGAGRAAFGTFGANLDLTDETPGGPFVAIEAQSDDVAAIVHTSGATGPAKAVRYSHRALTAQRDALTQLFDVRPGAAYTTSFGAFMLLAPIIAMPCVRPDFDVNEPGDLSFDIVRAACERVPVTTAWLSPAAARRIVATAHARSLPLELVMLAGAPIDPALVRAVAAITGGEVRAPYGMTECLPVTDGVDPLAFGPLGGTATGRALRGCDVVVVALDRPEGSALDDQQWGEILVRAPWMFDGYDHRWASERAATVAREGHRWHRTGDVGYFADGVLFQLGRAQHVIRTALGPLPSVSLEAPVAAALGREVAAVAVGPAGAAVVALVLSDSRYLRLASPSLAASARAAASSPVAAVLTGRLPTDRRHHSKIDRSALARTVSQYLAGR